MGGMGIPLYQTRGWPGIGACYQCWLSVVAAAVVAVAVVAAAQGGLPLLRLLLRGGPLQVGLSLWGWHPMWRGHLMLHLMQGGHLWCQPRT